VRLTEAGRVFLNEASVDEAVQTMKAIASGPARRDPRWLCTLADYGASPARVAPPSGNEPGVRVQLHDLSMQEMLPGLRDGKLQWGIDDSNVAESDERHVFNALRRYAVCVGRAPTRCLLWTPGPRTLVYSESILSSFDLFCICFSHRLFFGSSSRCAPVI
jgi:hypothetical protein